MIIGGADGDRTHDLMNAIHALSQLSYSPTGSLIKSKITQPKMCCQIHLKITTSPSMGEGWGEGGNGFGLGNELT